MPESSDAGAETEKDATAVAVRDAGDAAALDAGPARDGAATRPACSDVLGADLARLSCNRTRILVAGPIVAPPQYALPPRKTRRLLDAVARLLRAQPGLQLLRIEAYSSHDPGTGAVPVRREIEESQARADAVFRYLWRRKKISPERLDPVGYGFRPAFKGSGQRWPIVLTVVQRAR